MVGVGSTPGVLSGGVTTRNIARSTTIKVVGGARFVGGAEATTGGLKGGREGRTSLDRLVALFNQFGDLVGELESKRLEAGGLDLV